MRLLPNDDVYVGHTNNLSRRDNEHTQGKGCRLTASLGPGCLIYAESASDRISAMAREKQIKKWRRAKKLALATGHLDVLKLI
jgi:predicted GIY-YIG superfamily endonuclease